MSKAGDLLQVLDEGKASKKMVDAYLTCALWSSNDDDGNPIDDDHDIRDVSRDSRKKAEKDCADFMRKAEKYFDDDDTADDEQIGHDFWLTRNGHGAGFWDRDNLYKNGDDLTKVAEKFGEKYVYVGDDGKVEID